MSAEVYVCMLYDVGGPCLVIAGDVESGEFSEGAVGRTVSGKKFTVVKIEKEGRQISRVTEKQRVNIFTKNATRADIRIGDVVYID